jgi:uncharacterized membrane protein
MSLLIFVAIVVFILFVPEVLALLVLIPIAIYGVASVVVCWLIGIPVTVTVGNEKWVYRWFWRIK